MEEACGFGLAKRTSTLGSPTSNIEHHIGVPPRSIEGRYILPWTLHDLTWFHFRHGQLMGGDSLDLNFTLDDGCVNKGYLATAVRPSAWFKTWTWPSTYHCPSTSAL